MTVIIVTTVGYGMTTHAFSDAGKIFTIIFALMSVGTAAYLLSSTIQLVISSELLHAFGERRRNRDMNKLQHHFIICGAGRVGRRIIGELERAGAPFVVIESDTGRTNALIERGVLVIGGDATFEETLRDAGVQRARGLATCLPNDADNLYTVLTARDLNRELYIVARAIEEQAEAKLIRAGASRVVAPTIIGSHRMAQSLLKPTVADFIDSISAEHLDLSFEEVAVTALSPYVGQQLRATNIRSELNIVIVAIKRRDGAMIFNPSGEARMERGDLLVAIGQAESLATLKAQASGASAKAR
jgi:voltage-gated potassium channel